MNLAEIQKPKQRIALLFVGTAIVGVFYYLIKVIADYFNGLDSTKTTTVTASTAPATQAVAVQLVGTNSGEYTTSGDGIDLYFDIPHTFGVAPTSAVVTPASEDAQGYTRIEKTATFVRVHYAVAPPEGTNNLIFNYSFTR